MALARSDYVRAMALIHTMSAFEALRAKERNGSNVSVVKAALKLIGIDCGAARPPATWPLPETDQQALAGLVSSWET